MLEHLDRELILKCKIPSNEKCESDSECPRLNKCMYGKCKGFEGAFCTKDDECFKSSSNNDNVFFCMPNYKEFLSEEKSELKKHFYGRIT